MATAENLSRDEAEPPFAARYAQQLLDDLRAPQVSSRIHLHPARAWAQAGLMSLVADQPSPSSMCPLPLASCAEAALELLASLSGSAALTRISGAQLLGERAALMGLHARGTVSAGGACQLLRVGEASLALSLPRDDDWALLPAWLECEPLIAPGDWTALQEQLRHRDAEALLPRGQELGLALALNQFKPAGDEPWLRRHQGPPLAPRLSAPRRAPRVIELASLWAGPLCGHLLQQAGAEVIKLESLQRPDGARRGNADFYDLLNAGKRSVALDFHSAEGRAQLRALIAQADIVIEGSRPRALRQLGIQAETLLAEHPQLSWIAISAYGREPEREHCIGYGDDVAVAAGLSAIQAQASGVTGFVGDAIADPLTGLHAALAAWAAYASGGGRLLAVSLYGVMRSLIRFAALPDAAAWQRRQQHWQRLVQADDLKPLQARTPTARAAALGADTAAVLRDWSVPC